MRLIAARNSISGFIAVEEMWPYNGASDRRKYYGMCRCGYFVLIYMREVNVFMCLLLAIWYLMGLAMR